MPSADRLSEFVTIVDAGSISAAARLLGVPRATLSRRLSHLESELGVRLVHRRTRSLVLTEAGVELCRRARRIAAETTEAWDAVRRLDDTPRGPLRVSVSEGIDPGLFLDFLADFPEVSLVVRSTARYVDLLREGVDVAIRYGEVTEPDLYVRRVATIRAVVVASPSYLSRYGMPEGADSLRDHVCVRRASGSGAPSSAWPLVSGGSVTVAGRLVADDLALLLAAAVRGAGLALLPSPVLGGHIESGRLVSVLEGEVGEEFPVSVVYADRDYIAPKVRVFVDRVAARLPQWFDGSSIDLRRLPS